MSLPFYAATDFARRGLVLPFGKFRLANSPLFIYTLEIIIINDGDFVLCEWNVFHNKINWNALRSFALLGLN